MLGRVDEKGDERDSDKGLFERENLYPLARAGRSDVRQGLMALIPGLHSPYVLVQRKNYIY